MLFSQIHDFEIQVLEATSDIIFGRIIAYWTSTLGFFA